LAAFIPSSMADATQSGIVQCYFCSLSWGGQGVSKRSFSLTSKRS